MNTKAISMTSALLLGAVMLVAGFVNLIDAGFGADFLRAIGSLDPGFLASRSVGGVVLAAIFGAVEGGIAGYLFGAIYNAVVRLERRPRPISLHPRETRIPTMPLP